MAERGGKETDATINYNVKNTRKMTEIDLDKTKQQIIHELVKLDRGVLEREVSEAEHKEMQEQLLNSGKLDMLGQLARNIKHELGNSLGAVKNAAYFLNMALEKPEPEVKEALTILEKNVTRSEKIISGLLSFARTKPNLRKVNINDVVRKTRPRANS